MVKINIAYTRTHLFSSSFPFQPAAKKTAMLLRVFTVLLFHLIFFLSGPFKVLLSSPAGLEEVMDYADFKEELSLLSLDDELTLEDEPDEQDLHELVSGNITVNGSGLIILPSG